MVLSYSCRWRCCRHPEIKWVKSRARQLVKDKIFHSRCLTEDEQSQWSADQLANHVFLLDTFAKEPSVKIDDVSSGSEVCRVELHENI